MASPVSRKGYKINARNHRPTTSEGALPVRAQHFNKLVTDIDNIMNGSLAPNKGISDSLTALAGGGQSGATALKSNFVNIIGTVATDGDSVVLPSAAEGLWCTVVNTDSAQYADVFPASGDQLESAPANVAFRLYPNERFTLYCQSTSVWRMTAKADSNALVGTPNLAGGVTAVEEGSKWNKVTKLTLTAVSLGTVAGGSPEAFGTLLYTLPTAGQHIEALYGNVGITATGTQSDTPDVGIGSTQASGANATLNGTTEEDYVAGITWGTTLDGTTEEIPSQAPNTAINFNDSGDTKTIYLNVAYTWAAGAAGALTAAGTVWIKWTNFEQ